MTNAANSDPAVTPERSRMMSRVRGKDTRPEMVVRRWLHAAGFRYRLHRKDLPGRPDLVLTRLRLALFVHGCFWHRHAGCPRASTPKTRVEFWKAKLAANVARDVQAAAELRQLGWKVAVIWECETRDAGTLSRRLREIISTVSAG